MISLATSIVHPVISALNNAVTSSSKHYVTLPLNLLSFRCLQSYQVFSYAQIYHFFSAARSRKKKHPRKRATTLIVQTKCIVTIGARDLFPIPRLLIYGQTDIHTYRHTYSHEISVEHPRAGLAPLAQI